MLHSYERRHNERADGVEIAQSLQAKRTKSSTERTYQSKVNIMKAWLAKHYPSTINTDTSELRVPLPKEAVLVFLGHICEAGFSCDYEDMHARDAPTVPLSASCVWGYRSALVDVYHNKLFKLGQTELRRVLDGYEKVINNLKKRGLMKVNEGKRQLKASGYELLARKSMSITPTKRGQSWATVLFGWSYFVLMWNLMSRSDSIDTIILQHVEWIDDAFVIENKNIKETKQERTNLASMSTLIPTKLLNARYSLAACICFAVRSGKQQLFIGSDNKNRFGRLLRRVFDNLSEDEIGLLSCSPSDIGTHSLRKGSSSYALGQLNGCLFISAWVKVWGSLKTATSILAKEQINCVDE